ncbi:MAG TPA: hypothetical protein VFN45_10805 [Myxococcaceae bacterium]|nr:hypothetical protein [Myxococcaceae bacterium]
MSARRLLGLLLAAAVALPACLLPQEDHIIQPLPPLLNQPPRILENLLQPAGRFFTVRNGGDCPNLTFLAPVSDPDVGDTLIYNFYVDPNLFPAFVKQATIPNNGEADRSDPATFEVSFATPGPLQQPGDHVVEVLVSDGALVNREPQPKPVTLLDGGTALNPTYAVTYAWTVTVVAGPCPPPP